MARDGALVAEGTVDLKPEDGEGFAVAEITTGTILGQVVADCVGPETPTLTVPEHPRLLWIFIGAIILTTIGEALKEMSLMNKEER